MTWIDELEQRVGLRRRPPKIDTTRLRELIDELDHERNHK